MSDHEHRNEPHYSPAEIPAVIEREFGVKRSKSVVYWHMQPPEHGGGGNLTPDFHDLLGRPRFYQSTIFDWHKRTLASKPGRKKGYKARKDDDTKENQS